MINSTLERLGAPRVAADAPERPDSNRAASRAKRPAARLDVRVIGVGGAGCSSLIRLSEFLPGQTRFLGIDTGSGLSGLRSFADVVQIGNGFGSGGDPAVAADLFFSSSGYRSDISTFIAGADLVILLAGLGRGTGSGIAPLIARVSKESGALTLAAVNMPFEFEGRHRSQSAMQALNSLQDSSDSVIVTCNEDLFRSAGATANTSLVEAFSKTERKISYTVVAIINALENTEGIFDEVRHSLRTSRSRKSVVITGTSRGLHAGRAAVEQAFTDSSSGAVGVSDLLRVKSTVIHVEGGIGLSAGQIAEAVEAVKARIGRLTELHISSVRELSMGQRIRVTLILAGSGSMPEITTQPEQFASDASSTWRNKRQKPEMVREEPFTRRPGRRLGSAMLPNV